MLRDVLLRILTFNPPSWLTFGSFILLVGMVFCLTAPLARAAELKDIESITVLADSRLSVPLAQIASKFAKQSMISVGSVFGATEEQKKKIEDGESADLFITSDPLQLDQLKVKGLVDVYSISAVANLRGTAFIAAVIAGENMTPARAFLEYLKSPEAKDIFKRNGLRAP